MPIEQLESLDELIASLPSEFAIAIESSGVAMWKPPHRLEIWFSAYDEPLAKVVNKPGVVELVDGRTIHFDPLPKGEETRSARWAETWDHGD